MEKSSFPLKTDKKLPSLLKNHVLHLSRGMHRIKHAANTTKSESPRVSLNPRLYESLDWN